MNFYEQQLRNIFGNDDNIKYIGLDSETKVKATFVTGIVANQYNALRMEVLNRKDGCIDRLTLRFEDYFTRSAKQGNLPHIWDDKGNVMWYGTPLGSEFAAPKPQKNMSDASLTRRSKQKPKKWRWNDMNEWDRLSRMAAGVKARYPKGTRLELMNMNDAQAVPSGTRGTVVYVDDIGQIGMAWDNGRTLALNVEEDSFRKLTPEEIEAEQQTDDMDEDDSPVQSM